jgi:hypothetical protein
MAGRSRPGPLAISILVRNTRVVIVDWPREFDRQLDRLEGAANKGDKRAQLVLKKVTYELVLLQELEEAPVEDTLSIKRVRQSKRHTVWRVSHPYTEGIAVRLVCWFPPETNMAVVALFSGDKANMGDVFYDSVGSRADALIDTWIQEREEN